MRKWQRSFAALFVGCLVAIAPISSDYTAGLIGVESLCAQETPIERCTGHWQRISEAAQLGCAEGQVAHCSVFCDPETGDLTRSECICATPTPDDVGEGEGGGTE
ncbi:MAG: hypothetical protein F4087_06500 [Gemmatimonadetes bacterium]|nr:hypothetical protein [Gemmatimonadota bacterium]MYE71359.1 hypothetical protein [Gemmatimonadota bacterium]MYJ68146.1 hypothetical protein [Gemmatimonadota bacterium]